MPLLSVAIETVELVPLVRVEPSAPSGVPNVPAARPNFVNDRHEMGEHVESNTPEAGPGAEAGVENSGMDVDMVGGGDDAFQNLFAIWTDQGVVEAQRLNRDILKIV